MNELLKPVHTGDPTRMATNLVNLDAMIRREDFAATAESSDFEKFDSVAVMLMGPGATPFSSAIRKPDFQRETSGWTPEQIVDLITSFLSGDLVPAIILWPGDSTHLFAIDGAHRLSALMAWVNDDYGDRNLSQAFYDNTISPEQLKAAEKTRKLVNNTVGSFEEHKRAIDLPDAARPHIKAQAQRISTGLALKIQWVAGNADKAEKSFFKINQSATPIDDSELKILRARRLPNAIAARAIMRGGKGHQFWQSFDEDKQKGIKSVSADLNEVLFRPPLNTPIKTLDLPVAGRPQLALIFDFVNLANDQVLQSSKLTSAKKRAKFLVLTTEEEEQIDKDGSGTLKYLEATKALARRISGRDRQSLGLHPAIYFYSAIGRYQPTAFIGISAFVKELIEKNQLLLFTKHREVFEEFLLANKDLNNQFIKKLGAAARPFVHMKEYYFFILQHLRDGRTVSEIVALLAGDKRFQFLKPVSEFETDSAARNFNSPVKSAVFLKEALEAPRERCNVCGARMHVNSISIDHITKREDGGLAILENGQLAHPYCNSVRDKFEATYGKKA
jgi:hypothetical protein